MRKNALSARCNEKNTDHQNPTNVRRSKSKENELVARSMKEIAIKLGSAFVLGGRAV